MARRAGCRRQRYTPVVRRIALLSVLCVTTSALAAAPSAELRNGKWVTLEPTAAAAAPEPEPALDQVESLLNRGTLAAAKKIDVQWIKAHPKTMRARERAVFLLARIEFAAGDRIRAFYFDDEVMDEFPAGKLFYAALDQQYRIASDYLAGHKDSLLGLPIVGREDEAIEMLYRIQQRSPGSPLAEKSLLRTADYYYADGDFDLARDAYSSYVKNYPRSARVPQVQLRIAFASLAQFRGTAFDAVPLLEAKSKLEDITAAYPDLAADEDVTALLKAINQTLAAKLLLTADFYARTHALVGATYMYRYLLASYPHSPEADRARTALKRMPADALAQPAPQASADYLPPTPASTDAKPGAPQ